MEDGVSGEQRTRDNKTEHEAYRREMAAGNGVVETQALRHACSAGAALCLVHCADVTVGGGKKGRGGGRPGRGGGGGRGGCRAKGAVSTAEPVSVSVHDFLYPSACYLLPVSLTLRRLSM